MISRWGDKGDGDFGDKPIITQIPKIVSLFTFFEKIRRLISMLDEPSTYCVNFRTISVRKHNYNNDIILHF